MRIRFPSDRLPFLLCRPRRWLARSRSAAALMPATSTLEQSWLPHMARQRLVRLLPGSNASRSVMLALRRTRRRVASPLASVPPLGSPIRSAVLRPSVTVRR